MMKKIWIMLMLLCLGLGAIAPVHAENIALVVNEDAITVSDVNDRLKLIATSAGLPDNDEIRAKLMPQIVGSLVEEQIMQQEAKKLDLTVEQSEIDAGFAQIAGQNKFTPDQFKTLIKKGGMNIATMQAQIRAQIAWGKVVQQKIRPQISISDSDIDSRLERIAKAKGKTEYLVAEIFLPVDQGKDQDKAGELAARLVKEIRAGKAPFSKVAQQFSQAAGSAQGGDLGWIQDGQLAPELDAALPQIGKGNIGDPVRTLMGYHILLVRDVRLISDETMPTRSQIMNSIGQERLERQARRYLMDLKSSAFIDNRLGK